MRTNQARLLIIGHGDAPMGYARVVHSLLPHWHEVFDCHQFVYNKTSIAGTYPWKVYPNDVPHDPHGFETIERLTTELEPDLIWVINNLHAIPLLDHKLREWSPRSKVVMYFPLEGDMIRPAELEAMLNVDLAVTYLEEGAMRARACGSKRGLSPGALQHIVAMAHGVDRRRFFPLVEDAQGRCDLGASQRLARERLFGLGSPLSDAFIVLNSNRNQHGKLIGQTIEGFTMFSEGKPENVKLYLNMGKADRGPDVMSTIRHHALQDRVIFSREHGLDGAFSDRQLNLLFNACQVGVNTSIAEGWGLVAFEHAATGRPQIVPRHSACEALWEGSATLLTPPPGPPCYPRASANTAIDPVDLAEALERYHVDEAFYRDMARKAYAFACEPRFDWGVIAREWIARFDAELMR